MSGLETMLRGLLGDEVDPTAGLALPPTLPERYRPLERLGAGAMGEVWRVEDTFLRRTVALKRLFWRGDPEAFLVEARALARLDHPGIIPVYDAGALPDGTGWITMRVVQGTTLQDAVLGDFRAIDAVRRAAEAVGAAHRLGVLHRDLKPENLLLGEDGAVTVIDWGLSSSTGPSGSPAWMAPEIARGGAPTPRTDVFGLGACLYAVTHGGPPWRADTVEAVLALARAGELPLIAQHVPEELAGLLRVCLGPAEDRPSDGASFAAELSAVLAGERARSRVDDLLAGLSDTEAALSRARDLNAAAKAARVALEVPSWAPPNERARVWDADADVRESARQVLALDVDIRVALEAALGVDPRHPGVHARLCERALADHAAAEAVGDPTADLLLGRIRRHLQFVDGPLRRRGEDWLRGEGAVTVHTDPPGATVVARPYRPHGPRVALGEPVTLGVTPLDARLPIGSWRLELLHPARVPVVLPIRVIRGGHCVDIRPGETTPFAIPLPSTLDMDERYVPGGWFSAGGDPATVSRFPPRRLWVDGFIVRTFPVSVSEWMAFLDDVAASGLDTMPLRPMSVQNPELNPDHILFEPVDGHHVRRDVQHSEAFLPDMAVAGVDLPACAAYIDWMRARTELPWRLPHELEWEKAGRGGDGRMFPWGDEADPSFVNVAEAWQGTSHPEPLGTRPMDESPYGVRDLCASVRNLTSTPPQTFPADGGQVEIEVAHPDPDHHVIVRGGVWGATLGYVRLCYRTHHLPRSRNLNVGLRLFRSWPTAPPTGR